MPVSVSVLALVRAGAEQLVPEDVRQLVQGCLDAPADDAPKLVLADRLQDGGDDQLAFALRWMARHKKRPADWREHKKAATTWEWSAATDETAADRTDCLPGYLAPAAVMSVATSAFRGPSFLSAVAFVADRWAYLDAQRDVTPEAACE